MSIFPMGETMDRLRAEFHAAAADEEAATEAIRAVGYLRGQADDRKELLAILTRRMEEAHNRKMDVYDEMIQAQLDGDELAKTAADSQTP